MSPVPKSFFKEVTQLKVISTDVLSNATADMAFLLMLIVSRKAFFNYRRIIEGKWKTVFSSVDYLGQGLNGKALGIFGMGHILVLKWQKNVKMFTE